MQTYYDILNVNKNASLNDIKSSFRNLAKKYHPDINKETGAEEIFKIIQEAYEVLSNDEKRKEYDKSLLEYNSSKDTELSEDEIIKEKVKDLQKTYDEYRKRCEQYEVKKRFNFYFDIDEVKKFIKIGFWIILLLVVPVYIFFKTLELENIIFYFLGLFVFSALHKVVFYGMLSLSICLILFGIFSKDTGAGMSGFMLFIISFIAISLSDFFFGKDID